MREADSGPPPKLRRNFPQLGYAADLDPLTDEDIAGMIENRAVRVHELARNKLAAVRCGSGRVSFQALAEVNDDLIILVKDRNARRQVRHHDLSVFRVRV